MCVVCMHLCLGLSGSIFTQPYSYLLISWSDGINNFIHLSSHLLLYYKEERGGATLFWGSAPLAWRPYRACAFPPGLHLGIGRKREREIGTRRALSCGERQAEKKGERAWGPPLATVFQLPLGEKRGKGGGRGGSGCCHSRTRRERGRAAGRPPGGPPIGAQTPGAQAIRSQISGLDPSLLKYPDIGHSESRYTGRGSQPL